jgi:hypothetical protein
MKQQLFAVTALIGISAVLIQIAQYTSTVRYAQAKEAPTVVLIEIKEKTVEEKIRETFPEAPDLMVKVATCESGMKNVPGLLSDDGGIFQINQVHLERLKALGLDRFNIDDNIMFARMLYDERGLTPWNNSKYCWNT